METSLARGVVHLELHTGQLGRACGFYARLLGWRCETINLSHGSYLALDLGGRLGGGIVECRTAAHVDAYVEVDDVFALTARARELGASVLLEPREGPAGWRSVVAEGQRRDRALAAQGMRRPRRPLGVDSH